jgi:hypothetical protein
MAADHERTAVQLLLQASPPRHLMLNFPMLPGDPRGAHRRVFLQDEQGRTYEEVPFAFWLSVSQDLERVSTVDLLFPPLEPDAGSGELVLRYVTIDDDPGEATLVVPLAGKQPGDRIPLAARLMLGAYTFTVTAAEIVGPQLHSPDEEQVLPLDASWVFEQPYDGRAPHPPSPEPAGRELALHLEPGGWHAGRKLLRPMQVELNGRYRGVRCRLDPSGAGRWIRIRAPLPDDASAQVTVTFRTAQVAVEGPWRLALPLDRSR